MHYGFRHDELDFANFASQPIIMEIWKEFRVEWESVVFFGMNENVGEETNRRGLRCGGGGGVCGREREGGEWCCWCWC